MLIETPAHWMAAIRFALKPILLVGQWSCCSCSTSGCSLVTRSASSTTSWAEFPLIVMAIAAVYWLPIRPGAVVQPQVRAHQPPCHAHEWRPGRRLSFNSSLEQIDDIAMEQSFIGRTLGYADLTLYAASDTANEQYRQLMVGTQFKKAVLNAEAIRHGQPFCLMAAPTKSRCGPMATDQSRSEVRRAC